MFALLLLVVSASAQLSESFNSRESVHAAQLRPYLQNKCWIMKHAQVETQVSEMEGDGAIIMHPLTNGTAELYTPFLKINTELSVSFLYKSNLPAEGQPGDIHISLTGENNIESVELDKISLSSSVNRYQQTFTNLPTGNYKILISYSGSSADASVAIDQISFSAPLLYQSGCNTAPMAFNDFITGNSDRTAKGRLTSNDRDVNGHQLTTYLTVNSPDGEVTINPDNSFSFIPNKGFTGGNTQFRYRACDQGSNNLCSDEATVTINFYKTPDGFWSLEDFSGNYLGNGSIELNWGMTHDKTPFRIKIERSIDGVTWEKAGEVQSIGIQNINLNYKYVDRVGRNTANKKDLYYRLKLINSDQEMVMSRLLVVRVYNTASTKMVSITPNPVKKEIGVQLQLNSNAIVVMKLINNNGVEMMRKTHHGNPGTNSYLMEGSAQIKTGLYLLEIIINSKERMLVKLVKE